MIDKSEQAGPDSLRPMLATAGTLPVRDEGWAYEMKWAASGRWRLPATVPSGWYRAPGAT